ncbi:MAG: DUF1016 family protein [Planctomycetia bacterium]|nr:DUF1016 family protein [Planctomycetia bacterium]
MPPSWQVEFFERLVAASRAAEPALASAKSHPRKKIASFAHPQVRWIECAFDTNRITGNTQSQVLVIQCAVKRATEIDGQALQAELHDAGASGDVRIDDGLVLLQYRWGYGQGESFPLHDPRRVKELIDWTHAALRVVFRHLQRRQTLITPAASATDAAAAPDYALALEKYLEDLLVDGWDSLTWAASLQYHGRQVPCGDLGFIDILAQHRTTGDFVVIELKRDKSDDEVIGQLSRYMGWIAEHRAAPTGVGVRGIVVVHEVTPRLRSAALPLTMVDLYTYDVAVSLDRLDLPGRSHTDGPDAQTPD